MTDMITEIGMGTAIIPESSPEEPVVVVVPIDPAMPDLGYDVSVLRPPSLPAEDVVVTDQTETEVTLTVTRPEGFAGSPGLTVHVLCIRRNETFDSGWVDVSADLDAGWTGTVSVRKVATIAYLNFVLTPAASIDGTAKTDLVAILNGLDPDYIPGNGGRGFCVDESQQVLSVLADPSGSVFIRGTAGVTGTWVDGVYGIEGQISWVAGV